MNQDSSRSHSIFTITVGEFAHSVAADASQLAWVISVNVGSTDGGWVPVSANIVELLLDPHLHWKGWAWVADALVNCTHARPHTHGHAHRVMLAECTEKYDAKAAAAGKDSHIRVRSLPVHTYQTDRFLSQGSLQSSAMCLLSNHTLMHVLMCPCKHCLCLHARVRKQQCGGSPSTYGGSPSPSMLLLAGIPAMMSTSRK